MTAPVPADLISILAPDTADPLGSVIWPERVARNSWAMSIPPRQTNAKSNLDFIDLTSASSAKELYDEIRSVSFEPLIAGFRVGGEIFPGNRSALAVGVLLDHVEHRRIGRQTIAYRPVASVHHAVRPEDLPYLVQRSPIRAHVIRNLAIDALQDAGNFCVD